MEAKQFWTGRFILIALCCCMTPEWPSSKGLHCESEVEREKWTLVTSPKACIRRAWTRPGIRAELAPPPHRWRGTSLASQPWFFASTKVEPCLPVHFTRLLGRENDRIHTTNTNKLWQGADVLSAAVKAVQTLTHWILQNNPTGRCCYSPILQVRGVRHREVTWFASQWTELGLEIGQSDWFAQFTTMQYCLSCGNVLLK